MHGALIALDEREVSVIILLQGTLTIQVAFSRSRDTSFFSLCLSNLFLNTGTTLESNVGIRPLEIYLVLLNHRSFNRALCPCLN